MQRFIVPLIVVVVVIFGFLILRDTKDAYKLIPASLPATMPTKNFEDWREFTSESGKFKALFPLVPQHATENNDQRHYDMYVAEQPNGTIYMVSLIIYPSGADLSSPDRLLQTVMNELVASRPDNKLLSSKKGMFEKYQSLDFEIQNDQVRINGREFIKDGVLYLISSIANNEHYSEQAYEHFLNSFQLI